MAPRALLVLFALILGLACSGSSGYTRLLYIEQPEPAAAVAPPKPVAASRVRASPLALTSHDGTQLTLASLRVEAAIEGPLALTEYHMDFVNSENRTIEGRFEITLPPGATISRFAMRVNGAWQEAEVVERSRAQQVYEAILHEGLDPALLEQEAGNRFSARVFPISPRETKALIVAYTQALTEPEEGYKVALLGLPKLAQLDIAVHQRGAAAVERRSFTDYLATEDLVIPLVERDAQPNAAFVAGEFALVRVVPVPDQGNDRLQGIGSLVVLVDTSASRAVAFEAKLRRLESLVAELRRELEGELSVELRAFDQTSETIYRGPLAQLGAPAFDRLRARRALGASDLAGALAALPRGEGQRLLLATDGIATLGAEAEAWTPLLRERGFTRVDVLVDGSARDQQALARLVSEGLASVGQVIDLEQHSSAAALRRIRRASLEPIAVAIEGASWVSTGELRGLQPGDAALIFARLAQPKQELRVGLRGASGELAALRLDAATIDPALLERAVVQGRVAEQLRELERSAGEDPQAAARSVRAVVELATKHRVLTPYTAMLVLEDQAAYDRFGLTRDALAPILAIDEGEVRLRNGRDKLATIPWPSAPAESVPVAVDARDRQAPTAEARERERVVAAPVANSRSSADSRRSADSGNAQRPPPGSEVSRDFTAVVDLVPTATRDSAGISLAGTTGASSGYTVQAARAWRSSMRPAEVVTRRVNRPRNYAGSRVEAQAQVHSVVQRCYDRSLVVDGSWSGRGTMVVRLEPSGRVWAVAVTGAEAHPELDACLVRELATLRLPASADGRMVWLEHRYEFRAGIPNSFAVPNATSPASPASPAVTGRYAALLELLDHGRHDEAIELAYVWHESSPGDPLALVGLGHALAAAGELEHAARAYASLVDLHPARADIRRFAGNLLESLPEPALDLAIANYTRAVALRPDQPSSYRMLAFAEARAGKLDAALTALEAGLALPPPVRRYAGVEEVLLADLGLLASVWIAREPKLRARLLARVAAAGGTLAPGPSTRFVLSWETDANDVDLHVRDRFGDHAFYSNPALRSGGRLLADVTTGFGPEGFVIANANAYPYALSVRYFNQGSSGHGMGQVQVVRHDGEGRLVIENRTFVLMVAQAEIALGTVSRPRPR